MYKIWEKYAHISNQLNHPYTQLLTLNVLQSPLPPKWYQSANFSPYWTSRCWIHPGARLQVYHHPRA